MESTIIGEFDTRRGAELAVKHVVQECGVPRSDVFVQPTSGANTSGRRAAGADAKTSPDLEKHQKLDGSLEVSVDFQGDDPERIAKALEVAGAKAVLTK